MSRGASLSIFQLCLDMPSFVTDRCFLERLPLLTIMAKDDQCDVLALDQIKEFSRAGAQLLLILIVWPSPTIRGKEALQDNGINRQEDRTGLWQPDQNGLMSTGFQQRQAGQELNVSLNQPIAQGRLIPVRACGSKACMSTPRQFIVLALDNEFRLRKGIVIARVVHIEMGTDEQRDVVRMQAQISQMLQHIFFMLGWWCSWWWRVVRRESTIDEDVLFIAGLNQIAPAGHGQRLACGERDSRGTQLHEVKSLWSGVDHCDPLILS
jgi:hypothetical protein